jgi:transposase
MIEHLRTASVSASAAHTAAGKVTATAKLFLIVEPVDMRLGIDGLSAAIQTRLSTSPCAGGIYIFMNARGNRLKLLLWDGTGVWLALRRLHKGRFIFSRAGADTGAGMGASIGASMGADVNGAATSAHIEMSAEQWQWLAAGVDWQRLSVSAHDHAHWRVG